VSLFFTESPTNPFLRCVDIKLVSELCHKKGALLCIDGTFATPLNQKALALGADLIMHSLTKYMSGHHDVSQSFLSLLETTQIFKFQLFIINHQRAFSSLQVLGGCISGSTKVVSQIRTFHHILGGTLNPVGHFYRVDPP